MLRSVGRVVLDGGTYTRPMFTDQSNNQTHIGRIFELATAPGATHGENWGMFEGDVVVDTTANVSYICLDSTNGASIWETYSPVGHTHLEVDITDLDKYTQAEVDALIGAVPVGDVVGPASATNDALVVYDGTTGKLIKDSTGTVAQIAANTAANALDLTHRTGSGADHADVAANTAANALDLTHRTSDGKDHSDVVLNNAKLTNATHTGEVTGSGALTITADAVTNAKLANMTQYTVKVKPTIGTGDPTDVGMGTDSLLGRSGSGDIAGILAETNHITDNAITLAKMAHAGAGNLITYSPTGAPALVATGSAGQVLTSGGAGVAPTMQSMDHGGLLGLADDDHTRYVDVDGTREQEAVLINSRVSRVNSPVTAAELWCETASSYENPMWTGHGLLDWNLLRSYQPADGEIPYWVASASGKYCAVNDDFKYGETGANELSLLGTPALTIAERASAPAHLAGHGKLWAQSTQNASPMWTQDNDVDRPILTGPTAAPSDNNMVRWNGTGGHVTQNSQLYQGDNGNTTINGSVADLSIQEVASGPGSAGGYIRHWTHNTVPTQPCATADVGTQ